MADFFKAGDRAKVIDNSMQGGAGRYYGKVGTVEGQKGLIIVLKLDSGPTLGLYANQLRNVSR